MRFLDAEFVQGFIRMAKRRLGSRDGMREMEEIYPTV